MNRLLDELKRKGYGGHDQPLGLLDECADEIQRLQTKLDSAEKRVAELAESRAELAEQRNQLSIRLEQVSWLLQRHVPINELPSWWEPRCETCHEVIRSPGVCACGLPEPERCLQPVPTMPDGEPEPCLRLAGHDGDCNERGALVGEIQCPKCGSQDRSTTYHSEHEAHECLKCEHQWSTPPRIN